MDDWTSCIYSIYTLNYFLFTYLLLESSSKNLPTIYQWFTKDLPKIRKYLAFYFLNIYQGFTTDLPQIYQWFTKDLPSLPNTYQQLTKIFFNLPRIYHRFTNTILELNIFVLELSIVKDDVLLTWNTWIEFEKMQNTFKLFSC